MNSGIHLLSFSETWLHNQLPDNLFYLNYTLLRLDRTWNDSNNLSALPKKGGGVCTYINKPWKYYGEECENTLENISMTPEKILSIC